MVTRGLLLLMFPLFLTVSGCGDLILRDSDSAGTATGKVLTRILLCPVTICFSEMDLAFPKEREAREAKEAAYFAVGTVTPVRPAGARVCLGTGAHAGCWPGLRHDVSERLATHADHAAPATATIAVSVVYEPRHDHPDELLLRRDPGGNGRE
jgi:hypothetical protein